MEHSVVLVKPDGVQRALTGEIISRLEKAGLKLVAAKMVWIDKKFALKHYGYNDEWFGNVGKKLKEFYKTQGYDKGEKILQMADSEIGHLVQKWNVDYLTEGPVVAMVWEAPGVVEIVRKIVGPTFPHAAPPGTIRGDYAFDSPILSNQKQRSVHNLIHASGTPQEAELEIQLWFKKTELHSYARADQKLLWGE